MEVAAGFGSESRMHCSSIDLGIEKPFSGMGSSNVKFLPRVNQSKSLTSKAVQVIIFKQGSHPEGTWSNFFDRYSRGLRFE